MASRTTHCDSLARHDREANNSNDDDDDDNDDDDDDGVGNRQSSPQQPQQRSRSYQWSMPSWSNATRRRHSFSFSAPWSSPGRPHSTTTTTMTTTNTHRNDKDDNEDDDNHHHHHHHQDVTLSMKAPVACLTIDDALRSLYDDTYCAARADCHEHAAAAAARADYRDEEKNDTSLPSPLPLPPLPEQQSFSTTTAALEQALVALQQVSDEIHQQLVREYHSSPSLSLLPLPPLPNAHEKNGVDHDNDNNNDDSDDDDDNSNNVEFGDFGSAVPPPSPTLDPPHELGEKDHYKNNKNNNNNNNNDDNNNNNNDDMDDDDNNNNDDMDDFGDFQSAPETPSETTQQPAPSLSLSFVAREPKDPDAKPRSTVPGSHDSALPDRIDDSSGSPETTTLVHVQRGADSLVGHKPEPQPTPDQSFVSTLRRCSWNNNDIVGSVATKFEEKKQDGDTAGPHTNDSDDSSVPTRDNEMMVDRVHVQCETGTNETVHPTAGNERPGDRPTMDSVDDSSNHRQVPADGEELSQTSATLSWAELKEAAVAAAFAEQSPMDIIRVGHSGGTNGPPSADAVSRHVPISLLLPITDLSTPEARFMKRRQRQLFTDRPSLGESSSSVTAERPKLERFPAYYLESANHVDDTVGVLESLPWQYIQALWNDDNDEEEEEERCDSNELILWDEIMTTKLCELDAALEGVNAGLLNDVQPHKEQLNHASHLVFDLDKNIRLACMYLERSKDALEKAEGIEEDASGLVGLSSLLELWRQRDDYRALGTLLDDVRRIQEKETELWRRIDTFDIRLSNSFSEYIAILQLKIDLERSTREGSLSKLSCTDELKQRLGSICARFWRRMLTLLESLVVQCSRKSNNFNWSHYETLVKTVLDLRTSKDFEGMKDVDLAKDWSSSMNEALCHEADRALAMALLDPTNATESDYEKELAHLAYEFNTNWGDSAKVRSLTHNLVTLRFQMETKENYLSRVCHKLFHRLTEILHTHYLFLQWHSAPFQELSKSYDTLHEISVETCESNELKTILSKVQEAKEVIWDHCERVIALCFDEYINFAGRKTFFRKEDNRVDDSNWIEDLDGLNEVIVLLDHFLSLKAHFFKSFDNPAGLLSLRQGADAPGLYEKCCDILRGHLRVVHVEAMNTMGRLLANENWVLTRFDIQYGSDGTCLDAEQLLLEAITSVTRHLPRPIRAKQQTSTDIENGHIFARFAIAGNPFSCNIAKEAAARCCSETEIDAQLEASYQELRVHIFSTISAAVGSKNPIIAPDSVTRGLVVWLSRLLAIFERLPLIAEDTSSVFANIFDLYFTTVLRLCVGCPKKEKILLGIDRPSAALLVRDDYSMAPVSSSKVPGSPLFGSFRKRASFNRGQSANRSPPSVSAFVDAEIFAPTPKEKANILRLRHFVLRAQRSLQDVVNLDKVGSWIVDRAHTTESMEEYVCGISRSLEKREAAAWSCFAVAGLVDVVSAFAKCSLKSVFSAEELLRDADSLVSYAGNVLAITPTLVAMASQQSCVRAIDGLAIVKRIVAVDSGWEECKLNEHANDYVEELVEKCAFLWGFMSLSAKLPSDLRSATWERIVTGAYMSLLEGFARVSVCSTEGRALMTLDLASFSAGINPSSVVDRLEQRSLHAPTPPSIPAATALSMQLANFIKAFYLPQDDRLKWIEGNFTDYQLHHVLSLMTAAPSNSDEPNSETREQVQMIKRLYSYEDHAR